MEPRSLAERRNPMRAMALLVAILVPACGMPTVETATTVPTQVTPAAPDPRQELAAARARWARAGLDNCHFVFTNDCGECDPTWAQPHRVVVWDGQGTVPGAPTVDDLFTQIEPARSSSTAIGMRRPATCA